MPRPKLEIIRSVPATERDPLNVNGRLYAQVSELLTQLEEGENVTLKERYMALASIARIQYIFVNLRKEKVGDHESAGSSVRKYADAFKNDARGRKKITRRRRPEPEPDEGLSELDSVLDGDPDNDDAA